MGPSVATAGLEIWIIQIKGGALRPGLIEVIIIDGPIKRGLGAAGGSVMSMILRIEQARQAEARAAWAKGQLVVGAYYQHRKSGWLRRVTELDGRYVNWTDARGPGRSLRAVFRSEVSGPV
jgi:hypothetical protein